MYKFKIKIKLDPFKTINLKYNSKYCTRKALFKLEIYKILKSVQFIHSPELLLNRMFEHQKRQFKSLLN